MLQPFVKLLISTSFITSLKIIDDSDKGQHDVDIRRQSVKQEHLLLSFSLSIMTVGNRAVD